MSRHFDFGFVAVGLVALTVVLTWSLWDGTAERLTVPDVAAVQACTPDTSASVRSAAFRLGGTVVKADRWCGVAEVRVEVAADVAEDGFLVLSLATTEDVATLRPPHDAWARLRVGVDGWVVVSIVQADVRTLDGGGAWVTLTAGEPPR